MTGVQTCALPIFPVSDIPLTQNGVLGFQVENAMASIGAAWALGLDAANIACGLHSFESSANAVPGRFNQFQHKGATVIAETPAPAGPPAFVSPGAGARNCPHGTMTRIHGLTGKFGPYKGYFCPAKQGDPSKCTTQYIKQNQAEWNSFVPDQTKA